MKKILWLGLLAAALIITVPILLAQLTKPPARKLVGINLKDTQYQEVSFYNHTHDLKLGGMLFLPTGAGPFPAAIMIHGAGPSRRDSRWYLTLTQYLQKNGIAVLLPDKRGSERSEGDWRRASFEDLASDTLAAISFLKQPEQLAISKIGIIGLSQGGHIAPIVPSKSADVAFLVDVVGSSLPMHELLLFEENHNLREIGILPGISNLVAYTSSSYLRKIRQRDFWQAIGNFDPIPYWQRLTIPALALYGEKDTNVPSKASAERLRSLNKPNIRVKIYAGSGHALESPAGQGESIFRADALGDIRDFIHSK